MSVGSILFYPIPHSVLAYVNLASHDKFARKLQQRVGYCEFGGGHMNHNASTVHCTAAHQINSIEMTLTLKPCFHALEGYVLGLLLFLTE